MDLEPVEYIEPDNEEKAPMNRSTPIQLSRIPKFLQNAFLEHFYTELNYTTASSIRTFYRPEMQAILDLLIGRLIEPYYPESVYSFYGTGNDTKELHYYNISGNSFCVPVKYIKGLFAFITITDRVSVNNSDRTYRILFIGRGHDRFARKFNEKISVMMDRSIFAIGYQKGRLGYYTNILGCAGVQAGYFTEGRRIDSVVLDHRVGYELLEILRKFLQTSTERFYQSIGEAHHFNILLYGQPGTGKNSLVSALATELRMQVVRVDPTFFNGYAGSGRSLLDHSKTGLSDKIFLIDEVDLYTYNREKREGNKDERLIFPMLLDFLDNVGDSTIVIMTTNHIEKLDPALYRAGRVNRMIQFHNWSKELFLQELDQFQVSEKEFTTFAVDRDINFLTMEKNENGEDEILYIPSAVADICRQITLQKFWGNKPESKQV